MLFDGQTSFPAKRLLPTIQTKFAVLPQLLTIEPHFVRNSGHFVTPHRHRLQPGEKKEKEEEKREREREREREEKRREEKRREEKRDREERERERERRCEAVKM